MKAASVFLVLTSFALLANGSRFADAAESKFKRAAAPSTPGAVTMVYNAKTGNVTLNAGDGIRIAVWELKSAGDLLIPENATEETKDGLFDVVSRSKAFKLNPKGFTELNFGEILPKGLDFEKIRADTTVQSSLAGGGRGVGTPLLFVLPLRPVDDDGTWILTEFVKLREAFEQVERTREADNRNTEQLISDLRSEVERNLEKLEQGDLPDTEQKLLEVRQATIRLYLPEIRRLGAMRFLQEQQSIQRMVRDLNRFRSLHLTPDDPEEVAAKIKDLPRQAEELADRMEHSRQGPLPFGVSQRQLVDLIRGDQPFAEDIDADSRDDRFVNRRGDLTQGQIQSLRNPLRMLLRLDWNGERLTIDKAHWRILFGSKSRQEILAEVKALLESREISLPKLEGRQRPSGSSDGFSPTVARLFQNLRSKAGARSGDRSRNADEYRAEFRASALTGRIRFNRECFYLCIAESDAPNRTLSVRENAAGLLRVVLAGDTVLRMTQEPDGQIVIVELNNKAAVRHAADSFADLYRECPEYVEKKLFPLLDHLGIVVPPSRIDEQVVRRVIQRIQSSQTDDSINLDALDQFIDALNLLDSRSYLTQILPTLDDSDQRTVRAYVESLSDS